MKEAFDELVRRVDFFHDVIDFRGILECVSYAPKTRVGVGDFLRDGFHSNSREDLIDTLGGLSASRSHERDDDRWSLAYERATVVGSTHYVRELRSFRSVDLEEGLKAPFPTATVSRSNRDRSHQGTSSVKVRWMIVTNSATFNSRAWRCWEVRHSPT